VAGRPHFLAAQSTPEPNSTQSFPIALYPLRTQKRSYAWNGKILRSGSLPLKLLNSPPSPSLLFPSFLHILSCHGSLQCLIHCCRHEDDPSVERGTSHHGRIMCASHINRLGEGLKRYEGGHRRNWHAISDDGRPAGQVPWPASHCWWPIDPPQGGLAITCALDFPYCPGLWFASSLCTFPSSDDQERASLDHAHASFYGCPHPEEDNHPTSAGGSIKQQRQ
jgi:hypothetical protein